MSFFNSMNPFRIAIDFDGTIVFHEYPKIGDPVPGSFEWLKEFERAGAVLMLWTMRSDLHETGERLTEAVQFCRENGIEFQRVNACHEQHSWTSSPKLYANTYIDDAAAGVPLIHVSGRRPAVDWSKVGPVVMSMIKSHYA